jgi:hypothetical protein
VVGADSYALVVAVNHIVAISQNMSDVGSNNNANGISNSSNKNTKTEVIFFISKTL